VTSLVRIPKRLPTEPTDNALRPTVKRSVFLGLPSCAKFHAIFLFTAGTTWLLVRPGYKVASGGNEGGEVSDQIDSID
jgi:hypothetical protein